MLISLLFILGGTIATVIIIVSLACIIRLFLFRPCFIKERTYTAQDYEDRDIIINAVVSH